MPRCARATSTGPSCDPAGSRTTRAPDACSPAPTVPRGRIPRADVAATIAALLTTGAASRTQFELVSGDDPIDEAVAALG